MSLLRPHVALLGLVLLAFSGVQAQEPPRTININSQHISRDESIQYDYDIVYVRAPRFVEQRGEQRPSRWAEFAHPFAVAPGSDLVLLHPDGTEEVLVEGGEGAIQDPYVSFDGQTVFFTRFHVAGNDVNSAGADIYKIHVPTRQVTRLTHQEFALNRDGVQLPYGVYNMHPCPVPGGRVAFVSNRNGYLPPPKSYPQVAMQLHIMDEDGSNIETIGHLNLAGALHPVILKDGRLLFSSLENMGLRNYILWGIWSIHPDGTNWAPVVSALHGHSSPSSWHFQTQLSDENIIVELYYNQNQKGFGSLFRLPPSVPYGAAPFGPGDPNDQRNPGWRFLGSKGNTFRIPFTPYGMEAITPWIRTNDFPAWPSVWDDPNSPRIGKVTHPCAAPQNHLLLAWTLGPIGGSAGAVRDYMVPRHIDSGIYLLKDGHVTQEPGEMLLIKNDPQYNEQWPRPLVPYSRIHGVAEPKQLVHRNDGSKSPLLPEGAPFGLVGTSSLYKRESAPSGRVPEGSVTAVFPEEYDRDNAQFTGAPWNWRGQGADAGRYSNEDIHAIRILAFEPNAHTTAAGGRSGYSPYRNHAMERLRILGEIPVRKFRQGQQTDDPDGNPDTSFLARLPADVAFTFQTIDKHGMTLNMAQTWHQLRPGEVRHDCGGCHAHSQQPTDFQLTLAARPDYQVFDLTQNVPLLTSKGRDESGRQWDVDDQTGLRYANGPHDVEYFRDVRPILNRSCVACHTKQADNPAGGLVLDDDDSTIDGLPGTYFRLAADERGRFSPRKLQGPSREGKYILRYLQHSDCASQYVWKFQSRRSLLVWKLFGKRLDGFSNDTIATEHFTAGDEALKENLHIPGGAEIDPHHRIYAGDVDFTGGEMPPAAAVNGTYVDAGGRQIRVSPLTDEDRRTIVTWIDLGCPIELDPQYSTGDDPVQSNGYLADAQRPTLALTYPAAGRNPPLERILIGMDDYYSGLDLESFTVTADFPIDGIPAGENLAPKLTELPDQRWELKLAQPIRKLERGTLTVSVKDRAGNMAKIVRTITVAE